MVQLSPELPERVAGYYMNQKQCVTIAKILTKREENYKPALAFCKPAFVDPNKEEIDGYAKKITANQ